MVKRFISLMRWFLRRHSAPRPHRVLIVSTTGLGDTIWATPAIAALRIAFPSLYLAILTSPIGQEALLHNPHLQRIYLLKKSWIAHIVPLFLALYREKFDTILLFHASQRIAFVLSALLGAERVVGTQGLHKGMDWICTQTTPSLFQHEAERRLRIVEALGVHCTHHARPSFTLLAAERVEAKKKMASLGQGPWIALHPGAKEPFRRWPIAQWIETARQLHAQTQCQFLITGTEPERSIMEALGRAIPSAHLLSQNTSLRQTAALLEQMDLVLSNDTGPLHVAAALNIPLIGLYVATDPRVCGPFRALQATLITRSPTCSPCLKKQCRMPFCMLQIPAEEVASKALCVLTDSNSVCTCFSI